MDPDEALRLIRQNIEEGDRTDANAYEALANLVDGLDGWLSTGGFLPEAWGRKREQTDQELFEGIVSRCPVTTEGEIQARMRTEIVEEGAGASVRVVTEMTVGNQLRTYPHVVLVFAGQPRRLVHAYGIEGEFVKRVTRQ